MSPLSPPTRFADFEVLEELGSGGFATVYRAVDIAASREVALKVLHHDKRGGGYETGTRGRFMRETGVLAKLANPHTVQMHDCGEADGLLYILFELVPGRDLSELLEQHGSLSEPVVVHIMEQVLESLSEAHAKGMMHRDIKPDNIRVFESEGDPYSVKLIDFGIARASDDGHPSFTKTGEVIGTPKYMAPEQLMARGLGAPADVYSLGVVAMELLLGQHAMHGFKWSDQIDRARSGHVFSIPALERISPPLRALLGRMTAARPNERIENAEVVLAMLRDLGQAPPEPEVRAYAKLAAALVVAVICAAVVAAVLAGVDQTPPEDVRVRVPVPPRIPAGLIADTEAPAAIATKTASPDVGIVDVKAETACTKTMKTPFVGRGVLRQRHGIGLGSWPAYIPRTASAEPRPLVILMPHSDMSSSRFIAESGFVELAEEHQFVLIAPETAVDLYAYVDATSNRLCIDPDRIFMVGHGAGGREAFEYKCSPWLRALVTFGFRTRPNDAFCGGSHVAAYLAFASLDSPRDPVEGGRGRCPEVILSKESIQTMEERLRQQHVCSDADRSWGDGETCRQFGCERSPLVTCHVRGGQPWPGQQPALACDGKATRFPVAETSWSFFSQFASDAERSDEGH